MLIPVKMTLTSIQSHKITRKLELVQPFFVKWHNVATTFASNGRVCKGYCKEVMKTQRLLIVRALILLFLLYYYFSVLLAVVVKRPLE